MSSVAASPALVEARAKGDVLIVEPGLQGWVEVPPFTGELKYAKSLLPEVSGHDPATMHVTTLDEEKRINTFLRLASPGVIAKLREAFPDLPERPDAKAVFLKLRELRNSW